MSTDARWETLAARSELTSQLLSEDALGTYPGIDFAPSPRASGQLDVQRQQLTTECHLKFVTISFLSRLVTRNGRPAATCRTPNLSQRASGMDLGLCGLVNYSEVTSKRTDAAENKHCEASRPCSRLRKVCDCTKHVRDQLSNAGKRIEIGGADYQWFNVPC